MMAHFHPGGWMEWVGWDDGGCHNKEIVLGSDKDMVLLDNIAVVVVVLLSDISVVVVVVV